jgi:DNA-binding NarL/FixJ family response regulator
VISVLLVDDHITFRESLAFLLNHEPDITVVAQASSANAAREVIAEVRADVAVIDLHLPNGTGIDLIREMRAANPHAALLMLSGSASRLDYARAVAAGVSGICDKAEPVASVIDAIRRLCDGEMLISPSELVELLRLAGQDREASWNIQRRIEKLTPRERQILIELGTGGTDKAIAQRLNISHETVRTHMVSILAKLDVDSRLQALLFAIRADLIPLDQIRSNR